MSSNAATDRVIAQRDGDSARPAGAANVVVRFDGLTSRDGFGTWVELTLPVRLHDAPVDRRAFADRFLARAPAGTAGQVAEYLKSPLAGAAGEAMESRPIDALMTDAAVVASELRAAAIKPLFAVGLQVDGQPTARVGCPEWERRRVEVAAESARLAAAEREGELLRRFEDIRRGSPDVPAGALLMGLPVGERSDALRALLKAAGLRTKSRVFVAAGEALFEIDVIADDVRPMGLSLQLGPLRSVEAIVRRGKPALLVGARDGVFLVDPDDAASADAFDADVAGSPFGFSHMAYDDSLDVVHATHADVGLVSWQVGLGTRSVRAKGEFNGEPPRQVVAGEGALHVAAGASVYYGEAHGPLSIALRGASPVAQLMANDREIVVHRQSGGIDVIARRDGSVQSTAARVRGTPAACAALPWLSDVRLVIADEQAGGLTIAGAHDDVITPLAGDRGPYKALAAAADVVVAIAADRQRLLAWRPWEDRSFADLHLVSRTRSRVADVTQIET